MTHSAPVSISLPVAWGEMDALGHVNNVVFFRYLECARVEFMRRVGFNELRQAHGVGVILQHVQARFRRPLFFPDTVTVTARPVSIESDRFTLEHEIISTSQSVVAAVGTSTIVTYDYERAAKVEIPAALREAIEAMMRNAASDSSARDGRITIEGARRSACLAERSIANHGSAWTCRACVRNRST